MLNGDQSCQFCGNYFYPAWLIRALGPRWRPFAQGTITTPLEAWVPTSPGEGAHQLDGMKRQSHIEAVALCQQEPPAGTSNERWILQVQLVLHAERDSQHTLL